jgi:hypothetical protein
MDEMNEVRANPLKDQPERPGSSTWEIRGADEAVFPRNAEATATVSFWINDDYGRLDCPASMAEGLFLKLWALSNAHGRAKKE